MAFVFSCSSIRQGKTPRGGPEAEPGACYSRASGIERNKVAEIAAVLRSRSIVRMAA